MSVMYHSKYISIKMIIRLQRTSSVGQIHSQRGKSIFGDFVHSYSGDDMITAPTFIQCSSLRKLRQLLVLIQGASNFK